MKLLSIATAIAALLVATPPATQAGDSAAKLMISITLFDAGGGSDVSALSQQAEWEAATRHQAVIPYRAGAGGAKAWAQRHCIPGDGCTVVGIKLPHTVRQPTSDFVAAITEGSELVRKMQERVFVLTDVTCRKAGADALG